MSFAVLFPSSILPRAPDRGEEYIAGFALLHSSLFLRELRNKKKKKKKKKKEKKKKKKKKKKKEEEEEEEEENQEQLRYTTSLH